MKTAGLIIGAQLAFYVFIAVYWHFMYDDEYLWAVPVYGPIAALLLWLCWPDRKTPPDPPPAR